MKILIITGGTLNRDFVQEFLTAQSFDEIIVVDGALETASALSIEFQSLVGDFDTVDTSLLEKYLGKQGLYIERHRPQKDETDTELALELALAKMGKEGRIPQKDDAIVILGATGGRLDHMLGNIQLIYRGLKAGIACRLYDEDNCLFMIDDFHQFGEETDSYQYVSFLPFSERAEGVTLDGFAYPLEDAVLEKGSTLGISNEIRRRGAWVSVKKGILIGILSRDHGRNKTQL